MNPKNSDVFRKFLKRTKDMFSPDDLDFEIIKVKGSDDIFKICIWKKNDLYGSSYRIDLNNKKMFIKNIDALKDSIESIDSVEDAIEKIIINSNAQK